MGETNAKPTAAKEALQVADSAAAPIPEAEIEVALNEIENAASEIAQASGEAGGSAEANAASPRAGDASVANAIASEDELAEAFRELEQMSEQDASDIPSLGDGAPDEENTPASGDSDSVQNAAQVQAPAVDASASSALLPENELEAALAEIEKLSDADAGDIPSLDDPPATASAETCAPEQEEPAETETAEPSDSAEADTSPDQQKEDAPSDDPPPCKKKVRFAIGKKKEAAQAADYTPPAERDDDQSAQSGAPPTPDLLKRLLRILDGALDAINRPLAGLGASTRNLIGLAAIATLIVSLSAMLVLPSLLPRRDAIAFLQEKRAKLDAQRVGVNIAGEADLHARQRDRMAATNGRPTAAPTTLTPTHAQKPPPVVVDETTADD